MTILLATLAAASFVLGAAVPRAGTSCDDYQTVEIAYTDYESLADGSLRLFSKSNYAPDIYYTEYDPLLPPLHNWLI